MDEIEYFYDKEGNRHEVGPSMKDGPTGGGVLSCPICRACKRQIYNEKDGFYCELLKQISYDTYKCELYEPDKNSLCYELVQELIKRGKMLDKPWDFEKQEERK